jgi:hypothetical protein
MAYLRTDFDIASGNTIRNDGSESIRAKSGTIIRRANSKTDTCGPIEKKKRFVSHAGRFLVGAKTMLGEKTKQVGSNDSTQLEQVPHFLSTCIIKDVVVLFDQLPSSTWVGTRAAGRSARGTRRRASECHPKLLFHSRRHADWPDQSPTPRWERARWTLRPCGEPCGGDRYPPKHRDDARDGINNQRLNMGQHQSLSISLSIRDDSEQTQNNSFQCGAKLGTIRNKSERDAVTLRKTACPMAKRHVYSIELQERPTRDDW